MQRDLAAFPNIAAAEAAEVAWKEKRKETDPTSASVRPVWIGESRGRGHIRLCAVGELAAQARVSPSSFCSGFHPVKHRCVWVLLVFCVVAAIIIICVVVVAVRRSLFSRFF